MGTTGTETTVRSYEEACASHRWEIPERYNIAADVCDKHPRDKPAMVWEDFRGTRRDVKWGELQSLAARAANVLRAHGVERGDRVAVVAPATPETAAIFFGTWKLGAILLSMSVLYGDEGIRHRVADSQAKLIVCSPEEAERMPGDLVEEVLVLDEELLAGADDHAETADTWRPTILRSSTTPRGRPASPRASSMATATSSRTRSSSTATTSARASSFTAWVNGRGRRGSRRSWARGASARRSSSTCARAASTPRSSSRSSRVTA